MHKYKDIERDIANETDLVKVITRLLPVAMIKGCINFFCIIVHGFSFKVHIIAKVKHDYSLTLDIR